MRSKTTCQDCGTKNYTVDHYCGNCSSDLNQQTRKKFSNPIHKLIISLFTF
ncbi:hypothetical protein JCM16358_12460 [Halanaerocella petrolearia]